MCNNMQVKNYFLALFLINNFSYNIKMIMIDTLRKIAGIRKERRLPAPGPQPQTGSNIACEGLRIQLKYPINREQWHWFVEKGWRKIDMRTDRRHYTKVNDHLVQCLILADELEEREAIYCKVLETPLRAEPPIAMRR